MHPRIHRLVLLLVTVVVVASACGARVSDEQVASLGSTGASGASTAQASTAGADQALAPGAAPVGGAGDAPADASSGAATAAAGAGSTPTTASGSPAAPPAPSGGNGGATDVGVTGDTVTLGNVSTLSGPVPGLFQGAVVGSQAIVAYQNSKGGLFGRKFKLDVRDDQFDTGQNRSQTNDLIKKTFAFLGSFSLYDDAAAPDIQRAGIPDVSYSLSAARRSIPDNFAVQPAVDGGAPTTAFEWFKRKFPEAIKSVGSIYGDVPASKGSHLAYKAAAESLGFHWVYERGTQPTETDYTADVVRMRQSGVKFVFLIATDDKTTARLAKAMQQQGFKPDVVSANYMPTLTSLGGPAVEGWYGPAGSALFGGEDAGVIPEVALMNQWIQKVKPGYKSDVFSTYGWASGRLLFQAMEAAGPKATRAAVLAELRKIDKFTANDLLAEAGPASKRPSSCMLISQIKGGRYQRVEPSKGFLCLGPYHRKG
jgi:ABC-type branched-subunit amino acid transport system substrate-binding protein